MLSRWRRVIWKEDAWGNKSHFYYHSKKRTCLSSSFACHLLIFTSFIYSSLYFSTLACTHCFWKVLFCSVCFILSNSHSRSLILYFSWLVSESWWLALLCFMNSWVAACAWKKECTFNHHKEKENSPHLSVLSKFKGPAWLTEAAVPSHYHDQLRQNPGLWTYGATTISLFTQDKAQISTAIQIY